MFALFGIFILFISYVGIPHYVEGEAEKRILLNDPATIQSLLHQYETQLNKYGLALQQVESKTAQLENDNAKLKRENENMSSSLASVSTKNKDMNSSLAKLTMENSNLKLSLASLRTENNNVTSSLGKLLTENKDMKSSLVNLRTENKIINDKIASLQGNNQSAVVTYVRWGRTTCGSDSNTDLLYKGIVGGSYYSHSGSGINALCLPHNPDNGVNIHGLTSYAGDVGSLYGAEYQYNYKNVRIDDDVPCAVCLVKKATTVLMMPAKSSCPTGWKIQYTGILTTNYNGYHKSEYTCMDNDAEYIEGTRSNNYNGKLFYPVKTVCGSLPCPPYTAGTYVECAMCTI